MNDQKKHTEGKHHDQRHRAHAQDCIGHRTMRPGLHGRHDGGPGVGGHNQVKGHSHKSLIIRALRVLPALSASIRHSLK